MLIEDLIALFERLPGIGKRSARRLVLFLLHHPKTLLLPLSSALSSVGEKVSTCSVCGSLDIDNPCSICQDKNRNTETICVVETLVDLWAIERSDSYQGSYHVLGGTLSTQGFKPEELNIATLLKRIEQKKAEGTPIKEVILSINGTLQGQVTGHFLKQKLKHLDVLVTALAFGIPVGGELEYLDEQTLQFALDSRKSL